MGIFKDFGELISLLQKVEFIIFGLAILVFAIIKARSQKLKTTANTDRDSILFFGISLFYGFLICLYYPPGFAVLLPTCFFTSLGIFCIFRIFKLHAEESPVVLLFQLLLTALLTFFNIFSFDLI